MTDEVRQLTEEDKEEIRGTYAALRSSVPGFRTRASQSRMIGVASRTLATTGAVAACEAATGVGKSLAYLTAGVPIAMRHGMKLVVSTGTVALQEQLVHRDIPAFLAATKLDAKLALAKGRGRYACTRELVSLTAANDATEQLFGDSSDEGAAWSRAPQAGEAELVGRLLTALSARTWDGDLDRPPEPVPDELKPMLTTSGSACANTRCAHYQSCPFVQARAGLGSANIIVVNHSLLLADLALSEDEDTFGGVLLPAPSKCLYVIDEGHHLASRAREADAASVNLQSFRKRLPKLRNQVRAAYQALGKPKIASHTFDDGVADLGELEQALSRLEKDIASAWVPKADDRDGSMWRAPNGVLPDQWRMSSFELRGLSHKSLKWISGVRRALTEADSLPKGAGDVLVRDLGVAVERMRGLNSLCQMWAENSASDGPPIARWISLAPSDASLVLHASAVSAAKFLSTRLFDNAGATLVTSATLGDFNALALDTGLPERSENVRLPSPFNIRENGKLVVPAMRTSAKDRDAHAQECAQWMARDLDWTAGNLVIFTSKVKMDMVYKALPASRQGSCLVQGSRSKADLLAAHATAIKEGRGSTIFGMAAFGEGIDLPGELCSTVVITNLPFSVPSDPIGATFADWLEAQGRRPFDEVSVPEAIRVLMQYCGRLLRHESDKGRVVVLDRRLVESNYGRRMVRALPDFSHEFA